MFFYFLRLFVGWLSWFVTYDKIFYFHKILIQVEILDEIENQLKGKNIECDCLGGGRILHEPESKHILVYGYSQVISFI
jgi:hypothetical protein